jgi:hypothetical protein
MKNAITAITIPFLFFIVLHLLNTMIGWVFACTLNDIMQGAIIFTCIVSAIFTGVFYICFFGWLNEGK